MITMLQTAVTATAIVIVIVTETETEIERQGMVLAIVGHPLSDHRTKSYLAAGKTPKLLLPSC
jgi:hypothetical protein